MIRKGSRQFVDEKVKQESNGGRRNRSCSDSSVCACMIPIHVREVGSRAYNTRPTEPTLFESRVCIKRKL